MDGVNSSIPPDWAPKIDAVCRVNAKMLLEQGFGQVASKKLTAQLRDQLYHQYGLPLPTTPLEVA